MRHNEFDKDEKYKLYRDIKGILHPTISKKNISSYKIIINDNLIPLRVYYPKKVTNISNVVIFVHGDSKITKCDNEYSKVSSIFQNRLDRLIISLDYEEYDDIYLNELYEKIFLTVKEIYLSLVKEGIDYRNISLIGDSTGASALLYINSINDKDLKIDKEILFYPILSGEYFGKTNYKSIVENSMFDLELVNNLKNYYSNKLKYKKDYNSGMFFPLKNKSKINYPNIEIICGNVDPLIDETRDFVSKNKNIKLNEICFGNHGFINSNDDEIIDEYIEIVNEFLMKK